MAEAQNNLGSLYARGAGVKQDDVEAARLYRAAAEQGLGEAQSNIGYLYEIGAGVPQDLNAALMWYRRGADQDNTNAQFNLAGLYYRGKGVKQDFTLAYMWVSLAAAKGDAEAIRNRSLMGAQMTPAQLAEAQRLHASGSQPRRDSPASFSGLASGAGPLRGMDGYVSSGGTCARES